MAEEAASFGCGEPPLKREETDLYDLDWRCDACGGNALCPNGVRFRKKIWTLGSITEDHGTDADADPIQICMRLDKNATVPCLELVFLTKSVERHRRKQQSEAAGYLLFQVEGLDHGDHGIIADEAATVEPELSDDREDPKTKDVGATRFLSTGQHQNVALLLRGLKVEANSRKSGLGVDFVKSWISFCEKVEVECGTKKMDKPVLSLVLQKAGMTPVKDTVGVYVLKPGEEMRKTWIDWCRAIGGGETCDNDSAGISAGAGSSIGTVRDEEQREEVDHGVCAPSGKQQPRSKKRKCAKPRYAYVNEETTFLYSPNDRQARSIYAHSYLKTQNLVLFTPSHTPSVEDMAGEGKFAYVNTGFEVGVQHQTQQNDSSLGRPQRTVRWEGFCGACFRAQILHTLTAWQTRIGNL
ncbi:unnamed protein product [Amoebophrya sp. A120]|nr:unnamed protein product [Amoebophrya sp. A120]|eukprot:GSA120T00005462001.1